VTIKVVVCGCMLVTFVVTCLLHYALQLADVTDCVNCLVKVCWLKVVAFMRCV